MEEDWRRTGGGLEEDWRRTGGGLVGGVEEEWRRTITITITITITNSTPAGASRQARCPVDFLEQLGFYTRIIQLVS